MRIDLTAEQQAVVYDLVLDVKKRGYQFRTMGGAPGVGKSYVISYLIDLLKEYAVCAYTGKAAEVLRRRGVPATTIHSLIYTPFTEPDGSVTFQLAESLGCEGVIVDEASMVNKEIYEDLMSFGVPVIFVGDHGQLEPIGSSFNLMKNPDYKLEKIHRNAGTIARFCLWIRLGRDPLDFPIKENQDNKIRFIKHWELTPELMARVDQNICAFNKTRVSINNKVREYLGYKEVIEIGEKVMCLRNNRKLGVFNGMQGTVLAYYKKKKRHFIDFDSYGMTYHGIRIDPKQFGQEKTMTEYDKDGPMPFDYVYGITAHKAQGDQFDRILVINQNCDLWDNVRWGNTAASRAKELVYWCG